MEILDAVPVAGRCACTDSTEYGGTKYGVLPVKSLYSL